MNLDEMLPTDEERLQYRRINYTAAGEQAGEQWGISGLVVATRNKTLQAVVQMIMDLTLKDRESGEQSTAAWVGLMLTGAMAQADIPLKVDSQPQEASSDATNKSDGA
jgi:hypothetical protein